MAHFEASVYQCDRSFNKLWYIATTKAFGSYKVDDRFPDDYCMLLAKKAQLYQTYRFDCFGP